mgnify:CR=1 FL=1
MRFIRLLLAATFLLFGGMAPAQQVRLDRGSIAEIVGTLKPGQFVWAPELAPKGPMLLVVNLATQRAVLFRNGVPVAASTVSTGRKGYETPTGVFTVLQKHVEHYSRTYDNAPMPYMQRLTWKGVALHAGQLPGYPASHGCIRLPLAFAKLLYRVTNLGMTVVITDRATTPRVAPTPDLVLAGRATAPNLDRFDWHPDSSPAGPVSIVVSAADRRAVVLRNGIEIGVAPVTVTGPISGTWAYALESVRDGQQRWVRLRLTGDGQDEPVAQEEWQRFQAPDAFRRAIAGIVQPGTTVIVTADSLDGGSRGTALTVIEDEASAR